MQKCFHCVGERAGQAQKAAATHTLWGSTRRQCETLASFQEKHTTSPQKCTSGLAITAPAWNFRHSHSDSGSSCLWLGLRHWLVSEFCSFRFHTIHSPTTSQNVFYCNCAYDFRIISEFQPRHTNYLDSQSL